MYYLKKTLVIFSGGQDSTTCLGWALKTYSQIEAIHFKYGQKHSIETEQARKICKKHDVLLHEIDINFLNEIVDSALTSNGDVNKKHDRLKHLPASFVPNRNAIFITLAHCLAQKIGAEKIITGVCQTDFSGYPDCRVSFINAMENALFIGSETYIEIVTPLMYFTKAEVFELAQTVGILEDVIELSHTCYNGNRTDKHDWGYGCNDCPACELRKNGWNKYKNKTI